MRELYNYCRRLRHLTKRQQIELLDSLQFVGAIQLVKMPSASGRGRAREAWVAVDQMNNVDVDTYIPPEEEEPIA